MPVALLILFVIDAALVWANGFLFGDSSLAPVLMGSVIGAAGFAVFIMPDRQRRPAPLSNIDSPESSKSESSA